MMSTMSRLGWAVVLSSALICISARADATPSTLHIGPGANTACAMGGCPIFIGGKLNGEVNNIEPTGLDIYQNSGGASALSNPVLLILAIPDNSVSLTSNTITAVSLYSPYPGSPTSVPFQFGTTSYGINAPTGFAGLMNSGDVYSFLGVKANSSNSFGNWSAAELRMLGTNVTDFGIYVYSLKTGAFGANDLLDIQLSGIPEGTFAVAFGENSAGKAYATPFTEAGLQDRPPAQVPEPSTLALFAGLLMALASVRALRRLRLAPQ